MVEKSAGTVDATTGDCSPTKNQEIGIYVSLSDLSLTWCDTKVEIMAILKSPTYKWAKCETIVGDRNRLAGIRRWKDHKILLKL